jgi:hypothetical protein
MKDLLDTEVVIVELPSLEYSNGAFGKWKLPRHQNLTLE